MVSSTLAVYDLSRELRKRTIKTECDVLEKIIDNIERVQTKVPQIYNPKEMQVYIRERAETLKSLHENYFISALSQRYPLVQEDLFELKRYIILKKDEKHSNSKETKFNALYDSIDEEESKKNLKEHIKYIEKMDHNNRDEERNKFSFIRVPLFVSLDAIELENKKDVHTKTLACESLYHLSDWGKNDMRVSATLKSKIDDNLRLKGLEAIRTYLGAVNYLFDKPNLKDLTSFSDFDFKLKVVWIPSLDFLDIAEEVPQNKDPAMILIARGKNYLVTTWDIEGELPVKKFLREFSVLPFSRRRD